MAIEKILHTVEQFMPSCISGVFVEIGTDRGEGSTLWLANLAERMQTQLHTVDIRPHLDNMVLDPTSHRLGSSFDHITWHTAAGSTWAKDYGSIGQVISLLYLDNYDWTWQSQGQVPRYLQVQKIKYLNRFGIQLNNQDCQIEHLKQIMYLESWFCSDTVIVMDDTFYQDQTWNGKCGPAVIWLLAQGYQILSAENNGVIMSNH